MSRLSVSEKKKKSDRINIVLKFKKNSSIRGGRNSTGVRIISGKYFPNYGSVLLCGPQKINECYAIMFNINL